MKNLTSFLLITVLLFGACKNNSSGTGSDNKDKKESRLSPEAEHDLKLYRQAIERRDVNTAIIALNSYLLHDSSNRGYKDTLAELYITLKDFYPAMAVSKEILSYKPNDTNILKMHVYAAESVGLLDEAIGSTRKLYEIFNTDLNYKFYYGKSLIYSASTAQQGVKILEEIGTDPNAARMKTLYTDYSTGRQVDISLNLAAYMLLGQMETQLGNYDKAEAYFRKATDGGRFAPAAQAILQVRELKRSGGMPQNF